MHLRDAAFMQQIYDQLQFMQALIIGNRRLIARFDQRLIAADNEFRCAAAQHCLLTKQIGLGFLSKRRFEDAAAGAPDAMRVGERLGLGGAGGILRHGNQAGYAAALLVLPAHQIARPLRRDQHHVKVLARLDLLEVDVEAVREQQRRAFLEVRLDVLVYGFLRQVRHQHGDDLRAGDCGDGFHDFQAIFPGLVPALTPTHANDNVEAAILQVQCMRATLAAVT